MQSTTWPWRVGVNGDRLSNALRSKGTWRMGKVVCDWFWNCEMRVHNQQSSSIAAVCLVVSGVNRALENRTYSNLSQLKRFKQQSPALRPAGRNAPPWVSDQRPRKRPERAKPKTDDRNATIRFCPFRATSKIAVPTQGGASLCPGLSCSSPLG